MEAGMSRTDGFNGDGTQGGGREERTGPKPKKKIREPPEKPGAEHPSF